MVRLYIVYILYMYIAHYTAPIILFNHLGEAGIGKSCSMGLLALDWAENAAYEMAAFDFVFLLKLRYVLDNTPLEQIILEQHAR